MTLQFIIGQAVESLDSTLFQESQTVNASACEFMELIMKSIHTYKDLSIEITHLIINPLVKALRQAINSRNNAQQVHLLNLLQVIIIEGNFYSPLFEKIKDKQNDLSGCFQNAKNLFLDAGFIDCLVMGLKSNQSFVRYHFINFTEKIVPFMQQYIESKVLAQRIKTLIDCFCDLLKKADVSQYSSNFDKQPKAFKAYEE